MGAVCTGTGLTGEGTGADLAGTAIAGSAGEIGAFSGSFKAQAKVGISNVIKQQ